MNPHRLEVLTSTPFYCGVRVMGNVPPVADAEVFPIGADVAVLMRPCS